MSNRFWLNLILLWVGIVLAYIIWYLPAQQATVTQKLFITAPFEATKIRIQHTGKTNILLHLVADQWQLMQPGIAPVNKEKIKLLLTVLQEPIVATYRKDGKDLAVFGLDPGKIILSINDEVAIFGSTNPITLNRYIHKDDKIYTIKEIVYGVLGNGVIQLLSHHLLPDGVVIQEVNAPALFSNKPKRFWNEVEASNIAEYEGNETVLGKIELTLREDKKSFENSAIPAKVIFHVLAIKPLLVLGRGDLKVKYTFENTDLQ